MKDKRRKDEKIKMIRGIKFIAEGFFSEHNPYL